MATTQAVGEQGAEARPDAGSGPERPQRADARRNRERLVAAARQVFAEQGAGASMEAIAKQAGVGVGTLYRHFPQRLDVVEAVYRDDIAELSEAAERVTAELEPWPAVEAFFDAFMRYSRTKQALFSELQQAFEKNPELRPTARGVIDASFDLVIERAKAAGVVRDDIVGTDITQLLAPICTNASIPADQHRRLMSMILAGLRASAPASHG
jgi:AcrR family transcriptional regulator